MSSDSTDTEKRLAERRNKIFKMIEEASKKAEADFSNSVKRKMTEFEQMADSAMKANDPLNAAMYQMFADMTHSYIQQNEAAKANLDKYRKLLGS